MFSKQDYSLFTQINNAEVDKHKDKFLSEFGYSS